MRDFPFFTTDYGIASLVLKEIPYRQEAFIGIRDVQEDFFQEHLTECVSFCRMAGAQRIYAAGHKKLEEFPLYTKVLKMQGKAWVDPEKEANLFPVTEDTASHWRQIYNTAFACVDNASTLESRDEEKLIASCGAYFVHDCGTLLGIRWVEDNVLLALASVKKGCGDRVLHTLMSRMEGEQMTLEVASTNRRAIELYKRLGFLTVAEVSSWYQVG